MIQMLVWLGVAPLALLYAAVHIVEFAGTRDKERRQRNLAAFRTELRQIYQRAVPRQTLVSLGYSFSALLVLAGSVPLIEVLAPTGATPAPGYGWRCAALVLIGVLASLTVRKVDRWVQRP